MLCIFLAYDLTNVTVAWFPAGFDDGFAGSFDVTTGHHECYGFHQMEVTSDVEFVAKVVAKGDVDVVVRTWHAWLASSSADPISPPSEPLITELSDEDVGGIDLSTAVTGTGVKPSFVKKEILGKKNVAVEKDIVVKKGVVEENEVSGKEDSGKREAVGKPKKISVKGERKEEVYELPLVEDGDSIYVPEWSVCWKDLLRSLPFVLEFYFGIASLLLSQMQADLASLV
ncbi:hypothetical protein L1987_27072 [Smallanthus sonchifolius]|uniref:Uncharacterized protein n=1 Tax=Smallanthus sonchifolius TaxID=185202 RepID=A0ACB9ICF1_9ASTR|nr:hypothetical protein L1987_27072 [Smallanthus sonchifolius]